MTTTKAQTSDAIVRPAQAEDALHLACLYDAASRGLAAWSWSQLARPGQSLIEFGRERIAKNAAHVSHFASWSIAEMAGAVAGGVLCYRVPDPYDPGDTSGLAEFHTPVIELEAMAAGAWFIMAISVFPEYRGIGLGHLLLRHAVDKGRASGAATAAIMVESANERAHRLYHRFGFEDWARRDYKPFPGSRDCGEWILLRMRIA